MTRSIAVSMAVVAVALQGCSSMNVFGGHHEPALAATPAAAPDAAAAPKKRAPESARLARFDANGDGQVTKAELDAVLKADFANEDANKNGVLDTSEARTLNDRLRVQEGASPVFDWNGDGQLVFAEFATQWRTMFDRADRNQDGVVDEDELKGSGRGDRAPRPLPKPGFGDYSGS